MRLPGRWRAGPVADLSRLPVSLDLRAVSRAEGVRAALAIALVGLLGEVFEIPLLPEASLGALLTCLCDPGGPVRRRVPALLAFAGIGCLVTAGLGLLRPFGLVACVPVAAGLVFLFSMARVWGPAGMQVGNLLVVVTVLSLDRIESRDTALLLGGLFGAGSLYATLLTLVIWRVHPFRPARQALAEVFRRLGALVADVRPLLDGSQEPRAWEEHARAHRRHVRDGIEAARTLVLDTVRQRGEGSIRANQSLIQLEAADQLFGVLIAISDVLEFADAGTRAAAARAMPALRLLLAALADATGVDRPQDNRAVAAATVRMLEAVERLGEVPALTGLAAACVSRLRIALLLVTPEGLLPGRDDAGTPVRRWTERVMTPLRANLRWDSAILRHALRAAVLAAPALAVTLAVGNSYAHWFTITLVLTLQPFFATTWQRALERSIGTAAGGVIAAVIATVVHGPLLTALVMAPIAVAAFAVRGVNYGLFMAFLTPMVVLLSELGRPGESEFVIAASRAGFTAVGGVLAVLGGALLWPSWEPGRVRDALAAALRAHAAYADLELAALQRMIGKAREESTGGSTAGESMGGDGKVEVGGVDRDGLEAARRAAGVASNNLETALNRALHEPGGAERAQVGTALVADAALRRFAARLLAMQHDPRQAGPDPAALGRWRAWLGGAFADLVERRPLAAGPPPDREHAALGRMARQVELMAGALAGAASPALPAPALPTPTSPATAGSPVPGA